MNNLQEQLKELKKQTASEIAPQINEQETKSDKSSNLKEQLFSFVNPTEFVDLPSGGKYYSEEHPLHKKTSVEIRQMTAKEEDILTNKSFIKKGLVLDKLLSSILVDKSIDPETLLVGDKNAIMVAARITAYGPEYNVGIVCPDCYEKQSSFVDLNEVSVTDISEQIEKADTIEKINHVRLPSGNVVIKLPKSGWFVECRLLNGKHEKQLVTYLEAKKRKDSAAELELSEQLMFIVESINTVTDVEQINTAIKMMPAFDAKFLRDKYQELIPNVSIKKKFTCSSCSGEQEVEVPFTQEFFWPK